VPPLPPPVVVVGAVVVVVVLVGSVVVDLVLVSVLVLLVVDSVELVVGAVVERLDVELEPPPLSLTITTTAMIRPTMIASSAATR
jgi:hypothetical protein